MKRQIVKVDPEKCDGCGLCVSACAEGALQLVDGKAKLVSESYCDGLGACLPECPRGAITVEEREAAPFDEEAVQEHLEKKEQEENSAQDGPGCGGFSLGCGCPGTEVRTIRQSAGQNSERVAASSGRVPRTGAGSGAGIAGTSTAASHLRQWPCQLQLVPVNAPYLDGAHLLIAADCTAYAYAGMHADYMRGKVTLIGCPKLDQEDYAAKLAQILERHEIKSITVLKMEVPCCGGLLEMVKSALRSSGKLIPWHVVTISRDGRILEEC